MRKRKLMMSGMPPCTEGGQDKLQPELFVFLPKSKAGRPNLAIDMKGSVFVLYALASLRCLVHPRPAATWLDMYKCGAVTRVLLDS